MVRLATPEINVYCCLLSYCFGIISLLPLTVVFTIVSCFGHDSRQGKARCKFDIPPAAAIITTALSLALLSLLPQMIMMKLISCLD